MRGVNSRSERCRLPWTARVGCGRHRVSVPGRPAGFLPVRSAAPRPGVNTPGDRRCPAQRPGSRRPPITPAPGTHVRHCPCSHRVARPLDASVGTRLSRQHVIATRIRHGVNARIPCRRGDAGCPASRARARCGRVRHCGWGHRRPAARPRPACGSASTARPAPSGPSVPEGPDPLQTGAHAAPDAPGTPARPEPLRSPSRLPDGRSRGSGAAGESSTRVIGARPCRTRRRPSRRARADASSRQRRRRRPARRVNTRHVPHLLGAKSWPVTTPPVAATRAEC